MINLFFILTLLLTLSYVVLILFLFRGLFFLKSGKNKDPYHVSVVVAARNEEKNIGLCLQALLNQTYYAERYEIIIVDDRSQDGTVDVVRQFDEQYRQVKLVQVKELPGGISPKKHALASGIEAAQGEIIVTTDADCIAEPGWLNGIVSYFEPEVGLVAGFSPLSKTSKKNIFANFMILDSLSLAAVAAGSFGLGKPVTCNGRNLAYRKETFQSVHGYKDILHLVSGDDDLFLHLVSQKTDWKVRYAIDPETVVHSKSPINFKQFTNQRIRHASKGRYYSTWLKLLLLGVYALNLCLVMWLLISLFMVNALAVWFACLLLKSIAEFMLLYRTAGLFKLKKVLTVFPLAIVLHLFYVAIFGLWGQVGKFKWKDETFKSRTT